MRTDITDIVQRYRLALRHIWNNCFWVDPKLRTWDSVYAFRDLKLPLFQALVGDQLNIDHRNEIFGPGFEIVASSSEGLPLMQVNACVPSKPDEGIWNTLNGPFPSSDLRLRLEDLFDWSPLDYLDLRYYVVLIESFKPHPEKVAQHALVDVMHASVFWDPEQTA